MLIVLFILWGSVLVGYLLRRWPQAWVSKLLTISIWLMLFIIGIEVGGNEMLVSSLGQLGVQALLLTVITTLCCGAGSLLLWRYLQSEQPHKHSRAPRSTPSRYSLRGLWTTMHESRGVLCGLYEVGRDSILEQYGDGTGHSQIFHREGLVVEGDT